MHSENVDTNEKFPVQINDKFYAPVSREITFWDSV